MLLHHEKPDTESHPTSVRIATPGLQESNRQTTLPWAAAVGEPAIAYLMIECRQAQSLIRSADAALDVLYTAQIEKEASRMESSRRHS
jgi:hypothetical protein